MSLKSSRAWNDVYDRLIADAVKRCKITAVRCIEGIAKDGKPRVDQDWFTFALEEQARSIDGEMLEPGFPKDVCFRTYPDGTDGDSKLENTNKMNLVLLRKIVVCAFGLPANCKDAADELVRRGGIEALIGKEVMVKWKAADGYQNVVDILPVPAAAAVQQ